MKTHRLTEDYTRAFEVFLAHTTEKEDILAALTQRIETDAASSLLDIGAGNGELAFPLSRLVNTYMAIEPNRKYADRLRGSNFTVFQVPFPWTIYGYLRFAIVLASHVVPWNETESESFIRAAWKHVNKGGVFMMITYDEERSEWSDLLQLSGLPIPEVGQGRFEGYKKLLASLGALEVDTITTYVKTRNLEDMLLALSFVYGDGKAEAAQRFCENEIVRRALEVNYYVKGSYRFPFTHYLLQARKMQ